MDKPKKLGGLDTSRATWTTKRSDQATSRAIRNALQAIGTGASSKRMRCVKVEARKAIWAS